MLMINSIELVLLNQTHQMWEFQIHRTALSQGNSKPLRKIVNVRDMCVDIVAAYQVCAFPLFCQGRSCCNTKELSQHGNANFLSRIGGAVRGFHAKTGYTGSHKIFSR